MVYGLEQWVGVLITLMSLAHPLHPIKSRSRNKSRNLWVGWCISYWRPWFWPVYSIYHIHTTNCGCIRSKINSKRHTYQKVVWSYWCNGWFDTVIVSCLVSGVHFSCIVQYSLYHNTDISNMWHCTLVSNTPSQSIGLFLVCALFLCWVSLGAPVTISLI